MQIQGVLQYFGHLGFFNFSASRTQICIEWSCARKAPRARAREAPHEHENDIKNLTKPLAWILAWGVGGTPGSGA